MTLTDSCATIVKQIAEQIPDSQDPGLRLSEAGPDSEPGLALTPVGAPEPGDQVVEEAGAKVFLDAPAAQLMDDKVLDAQVNEDGSLAFGVGQQA